MKDIIEFTVSLFYNIYKLTYIYISVFKQWLEREWAYDNG